MKNKNIQVKVLLFFLALINVAILSRFSYAETIWEKRQKAINPEAQPKVEQKSEEITEPDTYSYDEEGNYDEEDKVIPVEQVTLDTLDPFNITVPAIYGTIIDSYKGTNGKLVVNIQSAHANYEAQKNIAGTLEMLMGDYGIKLIMREGGINDADFAYLRKEAVLQARINAAEKLLKNATITGIDYVNLTTDYLMHIKGMEDKKLYDENRDALWEMDKFKDAALEYVDKMSAAYSQLKEKVYSQELLGLDKAKKDYESETIDLLGYYRILNGTVQEKNIDISGFDGFKNLMKIDELEKKIDFVKINDNTAMDEQKALYKEYQDSLKNMNVNKVFKEEISLEEKVLNSVAENDDQKSLISISRAVSIMDKMLKVKLVPEEYRYFLSNKKDFDSNNWAEFLRNKSNELGLNLDAPSNSYALTDNLPKIERFYEIAGERDRIFIKKLEEGMSEDNVNIAALVAGGFHTPALTGLLSDAGYSYVVISPRVTTPTDDGLYRNSLKAEWLPEN